MYIRDAHAETDLGVLRRLIHENPLGILTTGIKSPMYSLLQSSHISFLLDVQDQSSETELGYLRRHMARQNPQSKASDFRPHGPCKLEGKFKMSQEMSKGDRDGVIRGFENLQSETEYDLAQIVRERGELKDKQQ
ncbi:hypothetical protein FZEAL_3399 [Fusarium zealandicum]|uniref:Uncharacterized protein n=1 Tax=Fusarium zealandicum TaxID=1053134 RepID=A0A8H4UPD9_9HYPO|nr:hypothetical protein FZEAL_3399 [Fusarium zealandicum]